MGFRFLFCCKCPTIPLVVIFSIFIYVFFDALTEINLDLEKSTDIFIEILYHFTVTILDVCGHIEGKLIIVHHKFG